MNRVRVGRPRARSERPWPGHPRRTRDAPDIVQAEGARAGGAFGKGAWAMMAWAGRRLWPAVLAVIRAVTMAHHEQVCMWECVLLTSGAAPPTEVGPLRWVASLGGDRLAGRHLPAPDPSHTGR